MIRPSTLLASVAAAGLALAAHAARAEVFCISQNPADGKLRGSIATREECIGDEVEIGSIVDAEQGILEFAGEQVTIPPDLRSDPQAVFQEVDSPPGDESEEDE